MNAKQKIWILLSCLMLTGCGKSFPSHTPSNAEDTTISTGQVEDFVLSPETSHVYITENAEDQDDITSYVTGISNGTLYLDLEGIGHVFRLDPKEPEKETILLYQETAKMQQMADTGGELFVLKNGNHELVFQEGSELFLADKRPGRLGGACVEVSAGRYSIPLTNLVFALGYDSLGASVQGDSIVYTLIPGNKGV